ncbi:MAG: M23 family metallopeptidase [Nitrospinota bacterium]
MFSEKYTVILMADLAGKMKRFNIPKNVVKFFIILFIIGASGFGYFSYTMLNTELKIEELEELRKISMRQKLEIQQFALRIEEFQKEMATLEKFDKKLRIITALETAPEKPNTFGVGGPNGDSETFTNASELYTASLLNQLNEDLDHLSSLARKQEISFHELDSFFKDQSSLLTSTPSIWPTRGWVTSGFGYRVSPFTGLRELHEGLDIATHRGAIIMAPANGVVVESTRTKGLGNVIEIDHGYGIVTRFGHNAKNHVKRGDRVKRGQVVATVGSTGRSTGPHLHYEIMLNGVPVNPLRYILTD